MTYDAVGSLARVWEEPYGDRRQELVLIGAGMDRAALTAAFDEALLTDSEMQRGPAAWAAYPNPFAALFLEKDAEPEAVLA